MCKDHARRRLRRAAMEWLEPRTLLSTYLVTTNADGGAGSLRQAMTDANANSAGAPNEMTEGISRRTSIVRGRTAMTKSTIDNPTRMAMTTIHVSG